MQSWLCFARLKRNLRPFCLSIISIGILALTLELLNNHKLCFLFYKFDYHQKQILSNFVSVAGNKRTVVSQHSTLWTHSSQVGHQRIRESKRNEVIQQDICKYGFQLILTCSKPKNFRFSQILGRQTTLEEILRRIF